MSPTEERLDLVDQAAFWSDYSSSNYRADDNVQAAFELLEQKETLNPGLPAGVLAHRAVWLAHHPSTGPSYPEGIQEVLGTAPASQTALTAATKAVYAYAADFAESVNNSAPHEVKSGKRATNSSPKEAVKMRFPNYLAASLAAAGLLVGIVIASIIRLEMSAFTAVYFSVAGLGLGASSAGFVITFNRSQRTRDS